MTIFHLIAVTLTGLGVWWSIRPQTRAGWATVAVLALLYPLTWLVALLIFLLPCNPQRH